MQKFDVWVYFDGIKEGDDTNEEYCGVFEGYLAEIIAAILTLYPRSIGVHVMPEGKG
jgi:hypothetical protein